MDSPVRNPVASELPRCAPPHTLGAGEEPEEGGLQQHPETVLVSISGFDDLVLHAAGRGDLLRKVLLGLNDGIINLMIPL